MLAPNDGKFKMGDFFKWQRSFQIQLTAVTAITG
jgi:hypothetical protein